jgi:hypothetical protein
MATPKNIQRAKKPPEKLTLSSKRDLNPSITSPTIQEQDHKKTKTIPIPENVNMEQKQPSPKPLRKMQIQYTEYCKPPYQVMLESKNENSPIGKRITKTLVEFISNKQNSKEGECCQKKNDRQIILEFNSPSRANNFVNNTDLSLIQGKAYIPPSFVEIVGIIKGVPTQYSDDELLECLSTFENKKKINHVRRFTRTNPDGSISPLETVAIHFQSNTLPELVKMHGGLVFSVFKYNKSPLSCKRCLNYGHPARLCKSKTPNCKFCSGQHNSVDCPQRNNTDNTRICYHCKGNHTGDSNECPKYQEQKNIIQRDPFPNLHSRNSIGHRQPPSKTPSNFPSIIPIQNRFNVLANREVLTGEEAEHNLEEMEWDFEGEPAETFIPEVYNPPASTPGKNKSSYATITRTVPNSTTTTKTRGKLNPLNTYSRSSTELSLRGQEPKPEDTPASLIKYVMNRQETQIQNLITAQSNAFQEILDNQQKTFQETISQITSSIPNIVTKVVETLLPSIIQQVKSTLAQDNSDKSSDSL